MQKKKTQKTKIEHNKCIYICGANTKYENEQTKSTIDRHRREKWKENIQKTQNTVTRGSRGDNNCNNISIECSKSANFHFNV